MGEFYFWNHSQRFRAWIYDTTKIHRNIDLLAEVVTLALKFLAQARVLGERRAQLAFSAHTCHFLGIDREIITQHGGRIELSTRPGEGTTFTVLLPTLIFFLAALEKSGRCIECGFANPVGVGRCLVCRDIEVVFPVPSPDSGEVEPDEEEAKVLRRNLLWSQPLDGRIEPAA